MNTTFFCIPFIRFWRKNVSAEFWPMQSYIGNVTCDICHVTRPDKWHVNIMYYRDILQIYTFNLPVLNLYPKSNRHHLLVGQKNLAKGQICLETNSTHVASTRAVLEVGGGDKWALMELSFTQVTSKILAHFRRFGFFFVLN